MIRIVTDGAADLPDGWDKEFDIKVIPINIHFGDKTFLQFVDMNFDEFYREIETNKEHPKTSQPSPHQFVEFYRRHFQPGETILSIHVTSKLSGTYSSCVAAAEELKGEYNIIPFDSLGGSMGIAFLCRTARRLERLGKGVQEIVSALESLRSKVDVILTLDTLEFARRSGRVGALSAALASLLNVKPIARLQDGLVEMVDKVRTRRLALERVIDMARERVGNLPVSLGVLHARDLPSAQALLKAARERLNVKDAHLAELSISLAINFGPGTLGLVVYPAE